MMLQERGELVTTDKVSKFIPEKDILIVLPINWFNSTVAVVNKDVYAGGFLILAGCLFVVANKELKFSLPEVKRGLFPMQVMASLIKIMPQRKVLDWCVRGYSISANEANKEHTNEDQIDIIE